MRNARICRLASSRIALDVDQRLWFCTFAFDVDIDEDASTLDVFAACVVVDASSDDALRRVAAFARLWNTSTHSWLAPRRRTSADFISSDDVPNAAIAGVASNALSSALTLAFVTGEIARVDAVDGDVTIDGDVINGVSCYVEARVGDRACAITLDGRVIVMTRANGECECASDEPFGDDDDFDVELNQIGRGEGEGECERGKKFRASASWRADGEYFACAASRANATATAVVRVFRGVDGERESTCERAKVKRGNDTRAAEISRGNSKRGTPLAWQPRGALIACAARAKDEGKDCVVFYERNGLLRGDFELPKGNHGTIEELSWSVDSQCLAVVVARERESTTSVGARTNDGARERERAVQIWTRSNMHWYLKHETRYSAEEGEVKVEWDAERGDAFHVFTELGLIERMQMFWETTTSDVGTCAVIDGDALMLTPMFRTPVPPPMCAARAIFDAPIVAAAFQPYDGERETVAVLLSTGALAFVTSVASTDWERTADVFADSERAATWDRWTDVEIPGETHSGTAANDVALAAASGAAMEHIAWVDDAHVAIVIKRNVDVDGASEILIVAASGDGAVSKRVVPEAIGMAMTASRGVAYFIARDSSRVYAVRSSDAAANGGEEFAEAALVSGFGVPNINGGEKIVSARAVAIGADADALALVTLDARGNLKLGDIPIASTVTSFALHAFPADGCEVTDADASAAVMAPKTAAVTTRVAYVTRAHQLFVAEIDDLLKNGARARNTAVVAEGDEHIGHWLHERSAADGARMGELAFDDLHLRMRRAMRPDAAKTDADATTRQVEEGARIIACAPGTTHVVLQMPRGNLETVAPKTLVLPAVACALRAGRYADAFALAAKQRVDLNLIVDYGWPNFIDAAEAFVRDVDSADAVMELLEALGDDDVTASGGIYEELVRLYPPRVAKLDADRDLSAKVDKVSAAIRRAIEAHNTGGRWELAVLTSYASGDDPDLGAALRRVAVLRERELDEAAKNAMIVSSSTAKDAPRNVDAAAALKHLLFLVGGPKLYASALGTYDLSLAYLVAQHAQMDPGEYVPELQELQSMREHARCAEIAKRLRRFEEAITEYLLDGDVENAGALSAAHKLFPHALHEASRLGMKDARAALFLKHADSLSASMRHDDAAVARLAAGDVAGALHAYRDGSSWPQAMMLASRLNLPAKARREIAEELCESLVMTDPFAAARVALTYVRDVDRAVELFSVARAWREAYIAAYSNDRGDLMETTIAPAAAGAAVEHLETFKENRARAEKYAARLRDLMKHRARAPDFVGLVGADWSALGGRPNSGDFEDGMDDGASEAPSLASDMSAYTDRTGFTSAASGTSVASTVGGRKKKDKKKNKNNRSGLRAGSPTEERDLAKHVMNLMPIARTLEEVGELLELLVLLGHEGDARTLQRVASEAIDAHDAAKLQAKASLDELAEIARAKGEKFDEDASNAGAGVEWKWTALKSKPKT